MKSTSNVKPLDELQSTIRVLFYAVLLPQFVAS